jgi:two-component system, chemotaxis family, sensor kinase CheA
LMPIAENVQKLSRQLRDVAFSIVLIPIENMLTRFQRLVRDLSSELGKDVVFVTEGAETELDKTIIESLADPLMHILRNSLDHGIEDAEQRAKSGKPKQGRISLKAFYSGANVMIKISDDGAGIDPEIITQKAIAKGIITADRKLSKREVLDLVFLPGFSTAKKVTDVSGRGVGMDVVKRKIADIRGEVEIDSELGIGTSITIKLPLTLSIIDGLLVKVEDTHFIIPLTFVDKIFAVEHSTIANTFNNVIVLDGKQVPFFYVRREFGHQESTQFYEQAIVVNFEEKSVGLIVDSVIGEYQAVLKPLGKHYKRQDMISGATILGDGTVALVMDSNKIIKLFANHQDFKIKDGMKKKI